MNHFSRIALAVFILLSGFIGNAQAQILLEQGKIKLKVKPGENVVDTLIVHNTSDQDVIVKAYWEDFNYIAPFEGQKTFFPVGTLDRSCGNWIKFSPQEFTLPPFGTKKISYTVNTPVDAQGGFNGVMFFEKVEMSAVQQTGVRLITRVGCLFFVELEGSVKTADIADLSISAGSIEGTFTNTSSMILFPKGTYYVMDSDGQVMDRNELPFSYLPPNESFTFHAKVPRDLTEGSYTLVITFDVDDGDSIVKEIDFEKDPTGTVTISQSRD